MFLSEISPPNKVVRLSAASRNSVVAMPFPSKIGTSVKDFRMVDKKVWPWGMTTDMVE